MRTADDGDFDVDAVSADVTRRFDEVPWKFFDSKDLAASGETRYSVSRIQTDLMKVAAVDPARAGRIWDEHVPDFVPRPSELPVEDRTSEPENGIEPGRRRRRPVQEAFLDTVSTKSDRPAPDQTAAQPAIGREAENTGKPKEPTTAASAEDARLRLLLDGLNRQYVKAEDKYHFRDRNGDVAFEAQDRKLLTRHETPAVVSSMIDLAETRGWSVLKLTGTDDFRREAWLQANLRDIEVSGYRPTNLDKARLDELRTERNQSGQSNIVERADRTSRSGPPAARFEPLLEDGGAEPKLALTPTQDQFLRTMEATMRHRGDSPTAIAKARELANERLTSNRVHVGTLVEVGTAPYQDKKGEKLSHFVTLENDKGEQTKVWGVDLPRAIDEAGAKSGQLVAVAFAGRRSVNVDVPVKDAAGHTLRTEARTVDRNSWEVVQFDRLREEAKASVLSAVHRQHNPAGLKVFDRGASPTVPRNELKVRQERRRERSV
jgi:putative DNA primase/helicase